MSTVFLDRQSRYKDTPVFDDNDGVGPQLGLFVVPAEFQTVGTGWRTHIVRQGEVGFLDLLSARYFGAGFEKMWTVIATVNNIIDPETDMYPGQRLVIPPASLAGTFANRSSST